MSKKPLKKYKGNGEEVDLLLCENHKSLGTWFPAVYDPDTGKSYANEVVEALVTTVMEELHATGQEWLEEQVYWQHQLELQ